MALARRCRYLGGSKRSFPWCSGYARRHGFATNPLNLDRLREAPHGSSEEVAASSDDGDIRSEPMSLDEDSPLFQRVLAGRDVEELPAGHKAGYVTLLGKPNAGKSTLLNAMVGQKLSIVTFKAQTTRQRVLGIVSEPQFQMVLQDTPGVISKKTNKLDQRMMAAVRRSVNDSDALLALVDLSLKPKEALDMIQLPPNWKGPPMAVVLNKEDLVTAEEAQEMKAWYEANCRCSRVMLASAMVGTGVQELQEWAVQHLPEGPAFYPKDMITEQPERFFVAEIVREKIFLQYQQEIPYCTTVNVLEFRERPLGQKHFVKVEVLCERESQKGMIIGKGGSALKRLAMAARVDIEALLESPVFLEVKVRTSSKWRADDDLLKAYGY